MSIKFFDMFSGIGGFRSGLEALDGFECVGYCEIDKYAKKAYEAIYDTEGELYFEDARTIDPKDLPHIDLIVGGFPCQSFSICGKRGGFEDARGTLFFEIARIAEVKRPKYLLLENVPGLLNHDSGRTFATILSTLDELGYDVTWQVLNSKDYGVPASGDAPLQLKGGCQGKRLYSSDGVGVTLTSGTGGFGGKTGIYLIEDFGLRIKVKTKKGFQIAQPGDTIDTAYATINSRRGRVGYEIAHTLTTSATQAYYFVDLNTDPQLTEIARCITARYNAGIGRRKAERSGIFLEEIDENAPFAVLIVDKNGEYHIGRIRRLTPRECWRLQGFTDEQFDKALAAGISDN